MRRAIARRMTESKQRAPHFYLSTEIEMDALLAVAERANIGRAREDRVTVTAFLLRATALTLAEHPAFNAVWNACGTNFGSRRTTWPRTGRCTPSSGAAAGQTGLPPAAGSIGSASR